MPNPARITVLSAARYAKPKRGAKFLWVGLMNLNPGWGTVDGIKAVCVAFRIVAQPLTVYGTVGSSYRNPRLSVSFREACQLSTKKNPSRHSATWLRICGPGVMSL